MNGRLIKQIVIGALSITALLAFSLASGSGGRSQGGGGSGVAGGGSAQSGANVQAGGGSDGQGGGLGDTLRSRDQERLRDQTLDQDREQARDRTRERLRTRDNDLDQAPVQTPAYKDSDGKEYAWQERFNRRLRRCEENEDLEGLARALHRIANRFRLSSEEDAEGFVQWALQNRPWAVE